MKYSEKSGEKITPYQLRHSFATLFLKNGGDVFSLQHLMAHSDLRMTKRYTELDESYIEQQHRSYSPALLLRITTLIISKKPGNTGISRDIRTEFTTDLLLSD